MKSKPLTTRERRRKEMKQQRLITTLLVVGAALIVVAILVAPPLLQSLEPVEINPAKARASLPNPVRNNLGDPNAPVTVVEFSDFQCSACGVFYQNTEEAFIEEFVETGKVYFTYRTMGTWIGPESDLAGQAAYCAGDQDKFWEYHDILFANQGAENAGLFSQRRLQAFAEEVGLDMGDFNDCLNSGKYRSQTALDRTDGEAGGVTGTPTFFINGKAIKGAVDIVTLRTEIEAALAAAATNE